jgi:hypothetical protein
MQEVLLVTVAIAPHGNILELSLILWKIYFNVNLSFRTKLMTFEGQSRSAQDLCLNQAGDVLLRVVVFESLFYPQGG